MDRWGYPVGTPGDQGWPDLPESQAWMGSPVNRDQAPAQWDRWDL